MKTPRSVAAASVVLLIGSLVILLASLSMFADAVESYRAASQALSGILNARLFVFTGLPVSFSSLGVATAIGLFGLCEWARKSAIFLSIAPVMSCALLLLFRPEAVFPPENLQGAILTIGSLGIVLVMYMFVILSPISIWWYILFTRVSVRSQFR